MALRAADQKLIFEDNARKLFMLTRQASANGDVTENYEPQNVFADRALLRWWPPGFHPLHGQAARLKKVRQLPSAEWREMALLLAEGRPVITEVWPRSEPGVWRAPRPACSNVGERRGAMVNSSLER